MILQVLPCLTMGGAENLVKEYLLHFDDRQPVELLCLGSHIGTALEPLLEARVPVTYMGESYKVPSWVPAPLKRVASSLLWRRWLRQYIRRQRPSVIHCHLTGARELRAVKGVLKGIKLVYTIHTDPAVLWNNPANARETASIAYLADKYGLEVVVLHQTMVAQMQQYLSAGTPIHVLNNGVDFERLRHPQKSRDRVLEEIGIPSGSLVVGHVGRFCEPKNHAFLVDVFACVHQRDPKAHLVLVGEGPLQEATQRQVQAYGLTECVHMLGNRMDVPDLLASFDVFLFPSLWEGFPMTLIEAQAAGVRCLVSHVITDEVLLTNLVKKMSLDVAPDEWATTLLGWGEEAYEEYQLPRYDMQHVMHELMRIYGL